MRFHIGAIAGGAVVVAFAAVFAWAYTGSNLYSPKQNGHEIVHARGQYGNYSYMVAAAPGRKQRTATFYPAPAGDEAVVALLRELARKTYGQKIADDVEPSVESVAEKNYITFVADGHKTYFDLDKNNKGAVTSARFWQD